MSYLLQRLSALLRRIGARSATKESPTLSDPDSPHPEAHVPTGAGHEDVTPVPDVAG